MVTVENRLGSFEKPIVVNNFEDLQNCSEDTWMEIYGRRELKSVSTFLDRDVEDTDGHYTISLVFNKNGMKFLSFNLYSLFPQFERINSLIEPFVKEVYRYDKVKFAGADKMMKKLKKFGYKENDN